MSTDRQPYRRYGDKALPEHRAMNLPPNMTCHDCVHVRRCTAMFGHIPADELCDWSPSRFQVNAAREYDSWFPIDKPTA